MMRTKTALSLLVLLTLGACSSTTFVYNRLDFLIPWYLGDYVNLNRPQKRSLDELLQPFLVWHRTEELPRYIALLDQLQQALDGELTAAQVETVANELVGAWERVEVRSLEWSLALGEKLSDRQVAEFLENLREKQLEYEEEYLPRSDLEFREETYENLLDSTQDFLGRLDWGQRAKLEEAAAGLRRSDAVWLQERAAWLERIEVLLRREPDWQQGMRDMLASRGLTTSPEYTEAYEHNSRLLYAALAQLMNSRSEKQDRRLRKKLQNLRDDLETLVSQG